MLTEAAVQSLEPVRRPRKFSDGGGLYVLLVAAFLELRDNTGDQGRCMHHLNFASWIPDLFMRPVEADEAW